MTTSLSGRVLLLAALGAILLTPAAGFAEPIYTFGQVDITDLPPSDLRVEVMRPIVFFEHGENDRYTLQVNLVAPGGASYETGPPSCDGSVTNQWPETNFVYVRPLAADLPQTNSDVIVFNGPVLGIISERDCMSASEDPFSGPGVLYPDSGGLEFETRDQDAVEVFPSGRMVWHRMRSEVPDWDGYRVVVETPAPDLMADIQVACPDSIGPFDTDESEELTFDITNASRVEAPDIQITFRIPSSASVVDYDTDWNCIEEEAAGVHICTYSQGSLRPDESDELKVTLEFVSPSVTSRVHVFGSGAVHDRPLENNGCRVNVSGPLPEDGGRPDGATLDGAMYDSAATGDTSTGGGPQAGSSFRGAGGCACDTAVAPGESPGFPLSSGLVLAWLALWSRRRRG